METTQDDRRFIVMPLGQDPFRDERGRITSSGALGEIGIDNAYLRAYPERPKGSREFSELEVGQVVRCVTYRLSGSVGQYDVWRVR